MTLDELAERLDDLLRRTRASRRDIAALLVAKARALDPMTPGAGAADPFGPTGPLFLEPKKKTKADDELEPPGRPNPLPRAGALLASGPAPRPDPADLLSDDLLDALAGDVAAVQRALMEGVRSVGGDPRGLPLDDLVQPATSTPRPGRTIDSDPDLRGDAQETLPPPPRA